MKRLLLTVTVTLFLLCLGNITNAAETSVVDLPLAAERKVVTARVSGLPSFFGGADQHYAVVRLSGLAPGKRYEVAFTLESGTDIGYGHSWVDGNPFIPGFRQLTGIGTGTGTGPKREQLQTFLFSVDPKSTSSQLYLVFRSHRPMPVMFLLQHPSGVTRESKDRWGGYYVTDFDVDRTSPFQLQH